VILTMLSMPSSWGSTFGAKSCCYDLIVKGHGLHTQSLLVSEKDRGHHVSSYSYIQD